MKKANCMICDRIKIINDNDNPYFVAELETGYVVIADYQYFKPMKLNIELLGNYIRHVHWHIVPRYGTDPFPEGPAWLTDDKLLRSEEAKPSMEELESLKFSLLEALREIAPNIVKDYSK